MIFTKFYFLCSLILAIALLVTPAVSMIGQTTDTTEAVSTESETYSVQA